MKRKISLISLFIIFTVACLGGGVFTLDPPENSEKVDIPLYGDGKAVKIEDNDLNVLIADFLGREYLLFESNTQILVQDLMAQEVQSEIEDNLKEAGWRLQVDWTGMGNYRFSQWQKGDLQLFVLTMDNLSSEDIREMGLGYGIQDLNPGESLTIAHIIDVNQPLPDLTSTADAYSWQATGTADAYANLTAKTAQAEEEAAATLSVEQTLSAEATQTAASAMQTAAVTPTATQDPHPDLSLPFEDDFNDGLGAEWRITGTGQPVFVDGKLTATEDGEVSIEIGNSNLQQYTLAFDLNAAYGGGSGSLILYFSSTRSLEIDGGDIRWYEFKENEWEQTSRHETNLEWGYRGTVTRVKIVRNGDAYEIFKDGVLEHTMKYGDPSGSKLIIQIDDNRISLDNLVIK